MLIKTVQLCWSGGNLKLHIVIGETSDNFVGGPYIFNINFISVDVSSLLFSLIYTFYSFNLNSFIDFKFMP